MKRTVEEVAQAVQGQVIGDGSIVLTGIAGASSAKAGDLTFAETDAFLRAAEATGASAVLVTPGLVTSTKTLIVVPSPRAAMARLLALATPTESFVESV